MTPSYSFIYYLNELIYDLDWLFGFYAAQNWGVMGVIE